MKHSIKGLEAMINRCGSVGKASIALGYSYRTGLSSYLYGNKLKAIKTIKYTIVPKEDV